MSVILVMTFCTTLSVGGGCIERAQPMDGMQSCYLSQPAIAEYMHNEKLDVRGYVLSKFQCFIGGRRRAI